MRALRKLNNVPSPNPRGDKSPCLRVLAVNAMPAAAQLLEGPQMPLWTASFFSERSSEGSHHDAGCPGNYLICHLGFLSGCISHQKSFKRGSLVAPSICRARAGCQVPAISRRSFSFLEKKTRKQASLKLAGAYLTLTLCWPARLVFFIRLRNLLLTPNGLFIRTCVPCHQQ